MQPVARDVSFEALLVFLRKHRGFDFDGYKRASLVRRIDKRRWDKKGIAYLHYEIGQPPTAGVLKLDDFAYERKPTDEMLERVEKNVMSSVTTEVAPATRA